MENKERDLLTLDNCMSLRVNHDLNYKYFCWNSASCIKI